MFRPALFIQFCAPAMSNTTSSLFFTLRECACMATLTEWSSHSCFFCILQNHFLIRFATPSFTGPVPSQQENIHAHSFVLGPELRIQYTYTYVKNYEHYQFRLRCTYLALFAFIDLVTDTNTHTREKYSWPMNSNSKRIHIRPKIDGNSKYIYSRAHGNS